MISFKYRPDVDGLRAVAVILVLLYHAGLGFSGGFIGVDVFFVISGFLITGLILKEQDAGKFRLANFWVRRIRRIIPASTVMVIVVLFVGGALFLPSDFENLGKATIAQQLMISNVYFLRNTGYFDGPADLEPLLHTWSLAVEEQFYLVYPFVLVFLRRFPKAVTVLSLLGISFLSFGASIFGVQHYPSETFYLLPTRAWELLIGGMLCFAPPPTLLKHWQTGVLSWIGFLGILAAGWFYSSKTPFPGLAALAPCGGAALLIYSGSSRLTGIGKVLGAKPVVFVGLISYSLYLWHWPVLAFTLYWQGEEIGVLTGLIVLSVSFFLGYFSWRFVETPFRRLRFKEANMRPVLWWAFSAVVLIAVATTTWLTEGMRFRFSERALSIDVTARSPAIFRYETKVEQLQAGLPKLVGHHRRDHEKLDFVVWGDSHAMSIGTIVNELANKKALCGAFIAYQATGPFMSWKDGPAQKNLWNQAALDYVESNEVEYVLLVARWGTYLQDQGADANKIEALQNTIRKLDQMGVKTWLMLQVPEQEFSVPRRLWISRTWGMTTPRGVSIKEHEDRQAIARTALSSLAGNPVILDPDPYCFDKFGYSIIGSRTDAYYRDDDHLSPVGAKVLLSPLLEAVFSEIDEGKTGINGSASDGS